MKKKLLAFSILLAASGAQAQLRSNITTSKALETLDTLKEAASNFTFNYSVKYLGPSLSGDHQEGATYNRFKTGQSVYTGEELDYVASHQTYQAFKLGYRLPNQMALSYSVTYQDDVKKGIRFNDGAGEREYGRSYNNHRAALFVPNIVNNNLFYMGTSVYYELPTTEASRDIDMQYGFGIQPSLGFYSNVPGLGYGIGASFERDVYPDNEYANKPTLTAWCKQNLDICIVPKLKPEKRQAVRVSVSPYMNYSLTDKLMLKSQLTFDWDQVGDQAHTTRFNANLDDIYSLGLTYFLSPNVNVSTGVEGSLNVPHIDRTAMFASLGLNI